jgi:hypothetical protein
MQCKTAAWILTGSFQDARIVDFCTAGRGCGFDDMEELRGRDRRLPSDQRHNDP